MLKLRVYDTGDPGYRVGKGLGQGMEYKNRVMLVVVLEQKYNE